MILIVEDDEWSGGIFRELLGDVFEMEIGNQKSILFHHRDEPVELVVLDIMLYPHDEDCLNYPGVSWHEMGLEFLRRLRAGEYEEYGIMRDVPVIAATAVIDYQVCEWLKMQGVVKRLEKPFSFKELAAAIKAGILAKRE